MNFDFDISNIIFTFDTNAYDFIDNMTAETQNHRQSTF